MQTLTNSGKGDETFTWNDWDEGPKGEYGWWDNGDGYATRKFKPAEGLWVSGRIGFKLQMAGQVALEDAIIALTNGNVAVGIPFPVDVAVQDIVANVGAGSLYDVSFQTLTNSGKGDETFTWNDWDEGPAGEYGWWDNGDGYATRKFKPGEGLWVSGRIGFTLRIPAPNIDGKDE